MAGNKKSKAKTFTRRDYPLYCMWHIVVESENKLKQAIEHFEISPQDWRVIFCLYDEDGMSISKVSREILIEASVLSRILVSLEKRGVIRRKKNRNDKRYTLLHLTAKGTQLYDKIIPIILRLHESNFQGLSKKERIDLMGMVNRMKENVYRSPYLLL